MASPTSETVDLIPVAKVVGTPVFNAGGEKLGMIEEVMLNKRTGMVAYAVMSFGGFLGIGRRHHPVPWDVLSFSEEVDGYVIDRDRAALESAPTVDEAERDRLADPAYRDEVDRYYRR